MTVCVHLSINCTWLNGVSGMGMKHKTQMTISRTVVNLYKGDKTKRIKVE